MRAREPIYQFCTPLMGEIHPNLQSGEKGFYLKKTELVEVEGFTDHSSLGNKLQRRGVNLPFTTSNVQASFVVVAVI